MCLTSCGPSEPLSEPPQPLRFLSRCCRRSLFFLRIQQASASNFFFFFFLHLRLLGPRMPQTRCSTLSLVSEMFHICRSPCQYKLLSKTFFFHVFFSSPSTASLHRFTYLNSTLFSVSFLQQSHISRSSAKCTFGSMFTVLTFFLARHVYFLASSTHRGYACERGSAAQVSASVCVCCQGKGSAVPVIE